MTFPHRRRMDISVIIPALNEAAVINGMVAHVRGIEPAAGAEIVVVDGDAAGSTIRTVRDERVVTAVSEAGRAKQMNRGAALATGDVLLFLHADTLLPRNAFALVNKALEDGQAVGGAFDLGIGSGRRIFRITERYVALRTRLTRVPFGDQAIFLRRTYFREVGGFKPLPIMEDVELMTRVRKRGDRIRIVPEKVSTSPRRWEREGVLYATFRNWMLQVLYALGVPPERLARLYP